MTSSSVLARLRIERGLTQQQLADRARVNRESVCRAETRGTPKYDTAAKIAGALGVQVSDLWPTLAKAVEVEGRLLETVIPITRAVKPTTRAKRLRVAYQDPDGGTKVQHRHRPPICCGANWCRCVDLADPETFPIFGDPSLIEFVAGGVNG